MAGNIINKIIIIKTSNIIITIIMPRCIIVNL